MKKLGEDFGACAFEHGFSNIAALLVWEEAVAPEYEDIVRLIPYVWLLRDGEGEHPGTVAEGY